MKTVETLLGIAAYLGLDSVERELDFIGQRALQENASLMLPLVGEFSSGKPHSSMLLRTARNWKQPPNRPQQPFMKYISATHPVRQP